MAGLKPSVNLFALLESRDPGDKRLGDFDAAKAKNTAPAAEPSARDYVIRQNQLEKKAKAKKRAAARAKSAAAGGSADSGNASKIKADGAKRGGYANGGSSRKQQSGTPGGYKSYDNKGAAGRQQQPGVAEKKVPGEGVKAPPAAVQATPPPAAVQAPPPPPSLEDINEFPSLK